MANIKSQIKRNKTNEKRRKFNHSYLSSMRTAIKRVNELLQEENKKEEIIIKYNYAISHMDKTLKKGIIKKNTCARKKSKLSNKVNEYLKK